MTTYVRPDFPFESVCAAYKKHSARVKRGVALTRGSPIKVTILFRIIHIQGVNDPFLY